MGSCRFCDASGWFFRLSERGLCSTCEPLVSMDLEQRLRIIADNERAADQTMNPHSKIAQIASLVKNLDALADYEKRGIQALGGRAQTKRDESRKRLDRLIVDTAREELDEVLEGVQRERTADGKVKLLERFSMKLGEYAAEPGGAQAEADYGPRVRDAIFRIRLNEHLEKADAAERAKDAGAAKGHYEAALNYLKSVSNASEGEGDRGRIEERLRKLQGA